MKFWKSLETPLAAWIHLLFTTLVGYAPYCSSSTCKSRDCRRKEHVIRTCFIDLWLWNVILCLIQQVEQFTIQFALFSFDILDNQHRIIWRFCFALLFYVRIQPFLQTKEQQNTLWLFFLFLFKIPHHCSGCDLLFKSVSKILNDSRRRFSLLREALR